MDISTMLTNFDNWRQSQNRDFDALAWEVFTNCYQPDSTESATTVGLANLQTACTSHSSAVVSISSPDSWTVFAHETGHIFGAIHDECPTTQPNCPCASCNCAGEYIMSAVNNGKNLPDFSSCTTKVVDPLLTSYKCLITTGTEGERLTTPNLCGNGLWEVGEQCDCGYSCNTSKCCNTACQLLPGCKCNDQNSLCCSGGQILTTPGKICRPVNNYDTCDLPDTCDGVTASCLQTYAADGTSCSSNGVTGQCLNTQCIGRAISCANLGKTAGQALSLCPVQEDPCLLWCQITSTGSCVGSYNGQPLPPVPDGLPCVDQNGNPLNATCYHGICGGAVSVGVSAWMIVVLGMMMAVVILL